MGDGREEEDGAGGSGEIGSAEDALEVGSGVGGVELFVEAGGEEECDVVFFGEVGECVEDGAGGGGGVGMLREEAVGWAEEVGDGVDVEEGEVGDGGEEYVEAVDGGIVSAEC